MTCQNDRYIGNYNFERMVANAKKRFVEGCNTIDLMEAATSDCEKEEIALVALLDVSDDDIQELQLFCKYSEPCKAIDYRDNLRKMIWEELAFIDGCEYSFT